MRRMQRILKRSVMVLVSVLLASMTIVNGAVSPAHATVATPSWAGGPITGMQVILRAQDWVQKNPTYSQSAYIAGPDADGKTYRTDCSGYVSMTWHLTSSYSTRTL